MPESKLTDQLSLELDGKINLVFRYGDTETRAELDGQMCLDTLVKVLALTLAATGPGRDA